MAYASLRLARYAIKITNTSIKRVVHRIFGAPTPSIAGFVFTAVNYIKRGDLHHQ
jgi:hypothetical protein